MEEEASLILCLLLPAVLQGPLLVNLGPYPFLKAGTWLLQLSPPTSEIVKKRIQTIAEGLSFLI
jgi:hypothetical protein